MDRTAASAAADPRLVITALGLTQVIGYGTLYYSFSVLAPSMALELGWSQEWVFGALSVALLAAGFIAPLAGHRLDRHGAGRVMTWGSLAAALALAASALLPGKAGFVLGLVAIEIASTFVQYTAAFALLVQIDHTRAPRSITQLSLIGGFASTLLWPLTAALLQHLSWREIQLVFAAVHLLICMPIHHWLASLSRPPSAEAPTGAQAAAPAAGLLPPALRPRALLLMTAGVSLLSFVTAATLVHMLPTLGALGLGAIAITIGTLFGPAQVSSRLAMMAFGPRLTPPRLALAAAVLQPLAIGILLLTAPSTIGAMAFAIVFGLGAGINSIVHGTLPLFLFGKQGYGALTGRVAAVRLVVSATAPFLFAALAETFGVAVALAVTAVLGGASIVTFLLIGRLIAGRPMMDASLAPRAVPEPSPPR